jgi:cellulose synthase/poly-beta-1,6-N-acetylglucosamine synthase-like glycosyltransferase
MDYFYWMAGTILALAWFSRIVDAALGMPSVANISTAEWDRNPVAPARNPRVSIIVPARNEEEDIEQCLTSLLALDYENYEVIAVDDRSSDRTGEIMESVSRNPHPFDSLGAGSLAKSARRVVGHPTVRVIHHRDLPSGWLGKTHAMWTAANQADGDWLRCGAHSHTRRRRARIMSCSSRR